MSGGLDLDLPGPGQMSFDLDLLMRQEVAAQPWHGAPLTYSADYYTPTELEAAFDRYIAENGRFGSIPRSHMWHAASAFRPFRTETHSMHLLLADGNCEIAEHAHEPGSLPGTGMYQANCAHCRWHSIQTSENTAVEAWHGHALPGWRDLPVVPDKFTDRARWDANGHSEAAVTDWVHERYPQEFLGTGCPILTLRSAHAGRHVPNRSPMGGYDLAVMSGDTSNEGAGTF